MLPPRLLLTTFLLYTYSHPFSPILCVFCIYANAWCQDHPARTIGPNYCFISFDKISRKSLFFLVTFYSLFKLFGGKLWPTRCRRPTPRLTLQQIFWNSNLNEFSKNEFQPWTYCLNTSKTFEWILIQSKFKQSLPLASQNTHCGMHKSVILFSKLTMASLTEKKRSAPLHPAHCHPANYFTLMFYSFTFWTFHFRTCLVILFKPLVLSVNCLFLPSFSLTSLLKTRHSA